MFGNQLIDYCFKNFDSLTKIAVEDMPHVTEQLNTEAKTFVKYYQLILKNQGVLIPFVDLVAAGLDMQSIALLSFLIFWKQGNKAISIDDNGITCFFV